jgi:hypothetical protein
MVPDGCENPDSRALWRTCSAVVVKGLRARTSQRPIRVQIWLPLVDALRTFLLVPTSDLRGILDHPWAQRHLGAHFGVYAIAFASSSLIG